MIYYIEDSERNVGHPTRKADMIRRWLKSGRAKIKKRSKDWILIKINKKIDPEKTVPTQFRIGIDPGYENIGFAVFKLTEKTNEKVLEGEAKLRTSDVTENLTERKMYRQTRRHNRRKNVIRKFGSCKFRKPVWKNRRKHMFQPTHNHLMQSHLNVLNKIFQLVPVDQSHIVIEYVKFDSHKLTNSSVKGAKYQKGPQYGYENVKNYVRARDNYKCQICKKTGKIEVHHIVFRSNHGTDVPSNLICLCPDCHDKVQNNRLKCPKLSSKAFIPSGVLNSVMKELYAIISSSISTSKTYGYITDAYRKANQIEKTHYGDANIIAFCDEDNVLESNTILKDISGHIFLKQFRRHNRSWVKRSEDRKYYDGKTCVAWNRRTREGQDSKKPSLTEFKQEYGYHKLQVKPGVIRYRRPNPDMLFRPGDTLKITPASKKEKFKTYFDLCKGWASTQGAVIGLNSIKNIPKKYVSRHLNNSGLVIDNTF